MGGLRPHQNPSLAESLSLSLSHLVSLHYACLSPSIIPLVWHTMVPGPCNNSSSRKELRLFAAAGPQTGHATHLQLQINLIIKLSI